MRRAPRPRRARPTWAPRSPRALAHETSRPMIERTLAIIKADAAGFYAVHRERPFFKSLCAFMTQGPCIAMVLEAEHAIQRWRDLMGATDPAKAAAGTIRKELATSIETNAVHGSDASAT